MRAGEALPEGAPRSIRQKLSLAMVVGAVAAGTAAPPAFAVPDWDGDGALAPADCSPLDPAVHPGAVDKPDILFEDRNCDGIDGDPSKAVFVSLGGNDAAPGTLTNPVRTVGKAISLASAQSKDVYVAGGEFVETVAAPSNVDIYGGYEPISGVRSAAQVTTLRGAPAIFANGVSGVRLQLLTLQGSQDGAGNAYALRAVPNGPTPSRIVLESVTAQGLAAANGAGGGTGGTGFNGAGFGGGAGGGGGCGAASWARSVTAASVAGSGVPRRHRLHARSGRIGANNAFALADIRRRGRGPARASDRRVVPAVVAAALVAVCGNHLPRSLCGGTGRTGGTGGGGGFSGGVGQNGGGSFGAYLFNSSLTAIDSRLIGGTAGAGGNGGNGGLGGFGNGGGSAGQDSARASSASPSAPTTASPAGPAGVAVRAAAVAAAPVVRAPASSRPARAPATPPRATRPRPTGRWPSAARKATRVPEQAAGKARR